MILNSVNVNRIDQLILIWIYSVRHLALKFVLILCWSISPVPWYLLHVASLIRHHVCGPDPGSGSGPDPSCSRIQSGPGAQSGVQWSSILHVWILCPAASPHNSQLVCYDIDLEPLFSFPLYWYTAVAWCCHRILVYSDMS